jgi:hypothetical protein
MSISVETIGSRWLDSDHNLDTLLLVERHLLKNVNNKM